MDIVDIWVDGFIRKSNVEDLQELPVYIIKAEIAEMKAMIMDEEVRLAGGSEFAAENIKNIKKYISVLKEVLKV
jgi:hypothetical protein